VCGKEVSSGWRYRHLRTHSVEEFIELVDTMKALINDVLREN
jgi:hypothetical protein